eukprot:GHVL01041392.1.p1 GENE.GHVL01041392.1~~GHVL01041392.1.p1  ORF type:complete len:318 (+),score=67.61 GHVL01041392.1:34-987(+)
MFSGRSSINRDQRVPFPASKQSLDELIQSTDKVLKSVKPAQNLRSTSAAPATRFHTISEGLGLLSNNHQASYGSKSVLLSRHLGTNDFEVENAVGVGSSADERIETSNQIVELKQQMNRLAARIPLGRPTKGLENQLLQDNREELKTFLSVAEKKFNSWQDACHEQSDKITLECQRVMDDFGNRCEERLRMGDAVTKQLRSLIDIVRETSEKSQNDAKTALEHSKGALRASEVDSRLNNFLEKQNEYWIKRMEQIEDKRKEESDTITQKILKDIENLQVSQTTTSTRLDNAISKIQEKMMNIQEMQFSKYQSQIRTV